MYAMAKTADKRICSSLCFSRPLWLCIAALVPCLVFTYFLSFGFHPFLATIPILVLSTLLIVTFKRKKVVLDENSVEDDHQGLNCGQKNLHGKEVGEKLPLPLETATQTEAVQQHEVGLMHHEYQVESPPDILFSSDSESSNDSILGGSFDLDLRSSNYMEQSAAISDVSVSDEDDDSLIEISLPVSKSGGLEGEPKHLKLQSDLPGLLPDSIFEQQGLMELLAEINEMNEEENLIEIDLSMGSIKCSRLEIEA
ncbi:uncharacterized protein LOC121234380 [Juglans microcarpa x Juglans regia]|uniref:uncharacterized protein LOC121234380 n=1 Tax=Juglans microcarpa x Juglans regia TaxID=2249226 RepID=UPI001B7F1143|nr:uncharacterized protein LOC121234380 [Juglans microcarpa x Juglans regia]XP_040986243.1 uncharacterized protein LOC121234380 [Juglans microcarpa x Juglans regia]XP_040986244.1 uncharacterized protein LOC121234380 [Juglans microcarpa x Juglans regia]